jgi:lipopolysaccharide transport system ATP-binding protein
MGTIDVRGLGKAYKQYPTRWSRLGEWIVPGGAPRHQLHWVLRDVSFHVEPGEAVGIVGDNGAGKSTLLKLITGTTQATAGSVTVGGRISAMLELGMGFHPDFTGRQNAYMAGQLLGLTLHEVEALMPHIESFAEIGEYIDQPVRIYSSGMQVRLAFAVATARRPDVLIVDEALAVGDAHFQHKSFSRIRRFQAEGTTLLLVTHDLATVRSICKRALWLEKGLVKDYGETRTVVDAYFASIYSQRQSIVSGAVERARAEAERAEAEDLPDVRQEFVNGTTLRNDIRVFEFDRDAARWGEGAVKIRASGLRDEAGNPLQATLGGERVRMEVECVGRAARDAVFVGFVVKDRTGQRLFGDTTYLSYHDDPVGVRPGEVLRATFDFRMPVLPKGTYVVAVAVASGTPHEHVVEEWIDAAFYFESQASYGPNGLLGIPMRRVELRVEPAGG